MLLQTWSEVFQVSLQGLWYGFVATFPKILLAVIVFILGWIVATTLAKIVSSAIDALKLDKLFKSAGVEEVLGRAGVRLHIGKFFGELVKWFIIIVFLVASLNILNLDQVTMFLQQVLAYIPQIIIAALILVAGTIFADFVRKLVSGGAAMAHVRSAKMLGSIAYYAIWILAIVTALDKLGIFGYFGQIIFTGLVVMLALGFGLAFGLGGKEAAGRWINKISDDLGK
ncbi:MAG: hypothetical protein KBC11_02275 [Candidatus Pacebacteria bacterium]|nr:hypothetical protein [Candidatus Paceibacterota bacterium]